VHQLPRLGLRDGPHAVSDLGQHLARQRRSAATPEGQLAHQLRHRAPTPLHDLGDRGPDRVPVPASTGEVQRRPLDRRERPSAESRLRKPLGALDEHPTGPDPSAVGRHQHVYRPRRVWHALHSVQLQRVDAGDHRTGAGVEQGRLSMIVSMRRRVAQHHDAGQHRPPRPTRPAAVPHRGPAETEPFQLPQQNDSCATAQRTRP
jgi:hypothetical protein